MTNRAWTGLFAVGIVMLAGCGGEDPYGGDDDYVGTAESEPADGDSEEGANPGRRTLSADSAGGEGDDGPREPKGGPGSPTPGCLSCPVEPGVGERVLPGHAGSDRTR